MAYALRIVPWTRQSGKSLTWSTEICQDLGTNWRKITKGSVQREVCHFTSSSCEVFLSNGSWFRLGYPVQTCNTFISLLGKLMYIVTNIWVKATFVSWAEQAHSVEIEI